MNSLRYKQFIEEVYFLGKNKEYSGFINNFKFTFSVFKPFEKALSEKRASYDEKLIKLYKKYHIFHFSLQGELDDMWEAVNRRETVELEVYNIFTPSFFSINNKLQEYIERTRHYSEQMSKYVERSKFII